MGTSMVNNLFGFVMKICNRSLIIVGLEVCVKISVGCTEIKDDIKTNSSVNLAHIVGCVRSRPKRLVNSTYIRSLL